MFRYVLGHDAMRKMILSNVLIVGLRGLGVEIGTLLYFEFNFIIPTTFSQKRHPGWRSFSHRVRP